METSDIKKYANKSVPELIKLATKYFNEFIRLRDSKGHLFNCISCGILKDRQHLHCGHYMSAGSHSSTRFDEDNCHGQCDRCNTHLHGNLAQYRSRLVQKIGIEKVESLERKARMRHKYERYALIEIIIAYREKVKTIKH